MNIRDYAREGWDRLRLGWNLRGIEHRNPILVYQMGKVGSSTVVQVLESLRLPSPVLHLHTPNDISWRRLSVGNGSQCARVCMSTC